MKMTIAVLLTAVLFVAGVSPRAARATSAKSLCPVCRVMEGATEAEAVQSVRHFEGVEYGFCSEKCAKAFDADPAAFVPPSLPRPAPAFSLEDLAGDPVSNQSLAGRVVLLDFWATWCAPCRKSMPELQAMHEKYAERGVSIVGVSIDEGGAAKVKKFVASKKFTYPIAVDSGQDPAWNAFRVKAIPAAYLIDQQGRIVAQWTGAPADARQLEEKLEELLRTD
jgi:peroxiredoxin/YHS domain-containing protein